MRETLGSQGVQTLLGKLNDQEKKTEDAEKKGEQAENKGTLDSYDSAITDAAQKSEEAKKEQEQQKIREIFRMQEMGMILPAVLMKA